MLLASTSSSALSFVQQPLLASSAVNVDLDATIFMHFIFFTAFVVIMKDLIFDPMLKVFEARESKTTGAIDDARAKDEDALAIKRKVEERMGEIRKAAANDREEIRTKVKAVETGLIEEARQEADAKLRKGEAKLAEERAAIVTDLDAQRAPLAADIASKVLGRTVQPSEVKS